MRDPTDPMDEYRLKPSLRARLPEQRAEFSAQFAASEPAVDPDDLHFGAERMADDLMERLEGYLLSAKIDGYDYLDVLHGHEATTVGDGDHDEGPTFTKYKATAQVRMFVEGDEPEYLYGETPKRYHLNSVTWEELKENIQGYRPEELRGL